jgi:hypothetical protein
MSDNIIVAVNPNSVIVSAGLQGPPGVSDIYEHTQASASVTWTINHNLNRHVAVDLFTVGGVKVIGTITNINLNQTIASFDSAIAGYATVK